MCFCDVLVFVGAKTSLWLESHAAHCYFEYDDTTSRLDHEYWSNFKEWVGDDKLVVALRRIMDVESGDITDEDE